LQGQSCHHLAWPSLCIICNLFCRNLLYLLPLHISCHSIVRMSADLRDLFFYEDFLYYYLLVVSLFHHLSLCHAKRSLPIEKEDKLIVRPLYLCLYINFMVLLITCLYYLVVGSKFMRLRTIIGQLCLKFFYLSQTHLSHRDMKGMLSDYCLCLCTSQF
jgi:hypothetical protein